MLTRKELYVICFILNKTTRFGTSPFEFKNRRLATNQSKLKLYYKYVYMFAAVLNLAYVTCKFPYTINETSLAPVAIHGIVAVVCVAVIFLELNLWLYHKEIMAFFNQTLQLNQIFGIADFGTLYLNNRRRELIFTSLHCVLALTPSSYGLCMLFLKDYHFSLYSLLRNDLQLNSGVSHFIFGIVTVAFMTEVYGTTLTVFGVFSCRVSTMFWLKKVCIEWPSEGGPVDRCILVYKSIYLLNNLSSIAFGRILVPFFKLVVMIEIVVCLFGLLVFSHELNWITGGFATLLAISCSEILSLSAVVMSNVYTYSSQFQINIGKAIRPLTDKKIRKWFEARLRACQTIKCRVGNFYFMDSESKLSIGNALINGLVFLLVQQSSK